MNSVSNVSRTCVAAKGHGVKSCTDICGLALQLRICALRAQVIVCASLATLASGPAQAVDGCKVLLCLAAPNWRAIPECVPTINQVMRDLARGKPFPVCTMSGAANSASHQWASAPTNCPPQYTREVDGPNGPVFRCDYSGAVAVQINGGLWARTWWNFGGDTVTEFAPAAKAQLGNWDIKFDDDYAVWLASLPPPAPPCPTC